MWQKIKMLILKIVFSPLWLMACFFYLLTKISYLSSDFWDNDEDDEDNKNIWKYWRL